MKKQKLSEAIFLCQSDMSSIAKIFLAGLKNAGFPDVPGVRDMNEARVVLIKNTSEMDVLYISESLIDEIERCVDSLGGSRPYQNDWVRYYRWWALRECHERISIIRNDQKAAVGYFDSRLSEGRT